MARSLASLSKRTKTIRTTQKITKAMKLVSMSKLQRYRSLYSEFSSVFEKIKDMNFEAKQSDRPLLHIIFFPDMGLASSFTKQLREFVKNIDQAPLFVIGIHGYDALKLDGYNIINEKLSSDQVSLNQIQDLVEIYQDSYSLSVVVPHFNSDTEIKFTNINTDVILINDYDQVFEPSYESANTVFQSMYSKCLIIEGYYLSKITEYTVRRIAMEKATESADSMLHDFALQYNRLRQERITEEISDLMSEEV